MARVAGPRSVGESQVEGACGPPGESHDVESGKPLGGDDRLEVAGVVGGGVPLLG